jgi:DNA helicase HerA-like ATPase
MTRPESVPLSTPVERQAGLTIGIVDAVSPDRIMVRLDLEAPQTTALNTGTPVAFPRLNGFVVIPNESGALVGIVSWLGVEHSSYPKRPGLKDFGLVDLPFPIRKMSVTPVGTLELRAEHAGLRRGVVSFPSVGDVVALPSARQLEALTSGAPEDRRVHIGRALLGNDAEIRVDPDKLFGRHLAVLGNTGSGKSCSVAGLIRWSMDAARAVAAKPPNSRFIVLDPNGEYRQALDDLPGFRLFQVPPIETDGATALRVPAWLLNSREWASVTLASSRTQQPVLTAAIKNLRLGLASAATSDEQMASLALSYRIAFTGLLNMGPEWWGFDFRGRMGTGGAIESLQRTLHARLDPQQPWHTAGSALAAVLNTVSAARFDGQYWRAFAEPDLQSIITATDDLLSVLPAPPAVPLGNEDSPQEFDVDLLADQLDVVAASGGYEDAARYIGTLKMRLRALLADERIRPIIVPDEAPPLDAWLTEFLGDGSGTTVAVIDLSLVPSEVVAVVVAVLSRLVFEALQRHRRSDGKPLPTALVLEEAHTFVRQHDHGDEQLSPVELCVRSFERIAREGRKFGLGLVLSSQRPSELSPTVLAQCNSFLLHRLVNDRDQGLVGKLVPDNLSGLLEDLPSLPARHALLLGWATPLPTLLEVRELPPEERPHSADPDFWNVWTGGRTPTVDWPAVAERWTGGPRTAATDGSGVEPRKAQPDELIDDDLPF